MSIGSIGKAIAELVALIDSNLAAASAEFDRAAGIRLNSDPRMAELRENEAATCERRGNQHVASANAARAKLTSLEAKQRGSAARNGRG